MTAVSDDITAYQFVLYGIFSYEFIEEQATVSLLLMY